MVNLPPPNNDLNVPEDVRVPAPKHAPIAPNPAPIQPNDYLADDEEDLEEEEEPIPEQAPAAPVGFEIEDNDDENDAEIIHLYEEADPLNRPPPSLETAEQEFMNAPVSQSTLRPLPPIRQFTGTFYVGEGSSATVFNPALCKVYPLDLWYRVESSSFKRLERNDMRMDSFGDDLTALDSTLREQIQEMLRAAMEKAKYKHMEAEYYKNHFACVSWYYDDLSGWEYRIRNQLPLKRRYRETPYDPSTNTTSRPRRDDMYVMVRDNAVRVDAASDHGGEGVDTTAIVKDWGRER
ncbi:hypothetical protein Tco_1496767 [Tanacetum coccineum]